MRLFILMQLEPCILCWDFMPQPGLFLVPFPLWPPATCSAFLWTTGQKRPYQISISSSAPNKVQLVLRRFGSYDPNIRPSFEQTRVSFDCSKEIQEAHTSKHINKDLALSCHLKYFNDKTPLSSDLTHTLCGCEDVKLEHTCIKHLEIAHRTTPVQCFKSFTTWGANS